MRATARDDDRVGHEIVAALDQVASYAWQSLRACAGAIRSAAPDGLPGNQPGSGPGILTGTEEDAVRVLRRLLGQRGDMQPAERHIRPLGTVVVGQCVGP